VSTNGLAGGDTALEGVGQSSFVEPFDELAQFALELGGLPVRVVQHPSNVGRQVDLAPHEERHVLAPKPTPEPDTMAASPRTIYAASSQ
jgi:hypothetical protein